MACGTSFVHETHMPFVGWFDRTCFWHYYLWIDYQVTQSVAVSLDATLSDMIAAFRIWHVILTQYHNALVDMTCDTGWPEFYFVYFDVGMFPLSQVRNLDGRHAWQCTVCKKRPHPNPRLLTGVAQHDYSLNVCVCDLISANKKMMEAACAHHNIH